MHVVGDVALLDQVRSRSYLPHSWNERAQRLAVGVGEFLEALKLAD